MQQGINLIKIRRFLRLCISPKNHFHPSKANIKLFKPIFQPTSMQAQELEKPTWLKIKEPELKKIIGELIKTEEQPAKIGLILRDQYGIPTTKLYGKKLSEYLKEHNILNDIELKNAEKKFKKIKTHLEKNITDKISKHKLQKAQSRLSKARKYFEKKKKE